MSFETVLTNLRKKPVTVLELDGTPLCRLQPGESFTVESISKETLYARWSAVAFTDGDDAPIRFKIRPNWTEPERGRWLLHLINQEGLAQEPLVIGGRTVLIPKNIPVVVGLFLEDPLIAYTKLACHHILRRFKNVNWPGIFVNDTQLIWEGTPRPQDELDEARRLLAEKQKPKEAEA